MQRNLVSAIWAGLVVGLVALASAGEFGKEVAVPRHLADGEELTMDRTQLLDHGQLLFEAMWTNQEGAGRPLTKGTGKPLTAPGDPDVYKRQT